MRISFSIYITFFFAVNFIYGQEHNVNYDESKVPQYELPDLLGNLSGENINNSKEWGKKRSREILQLYRDEVFGNVPKSKNIKIKSKLIEQNTAYNGKAIRKQIQLTIRKKEKELPINILIYLPSGKENPPVVFGYNYYGNQSITSDEKVVLSEAWVGNKKEFDIIENETTEGSRGKRGYRWPIEMILEKGFGLATVYYGEIDPDRNNFDDGLHPFFYNQGQKRPQKNEWGAIGAWAWGATKVLDYLEKDVDTKHSKYIMFGHSRLGKTSLWAGAQDQRFDMVISNDSGCSGAAISRRKFGETVKIINTSFPHWFSERYKDYNDKEENLPIDQHMLIALIAPRPVYIASAEGDQWADPKGEYLSGYHAGKVYELYQKPVLKSEHPPKVDEPLHGAIIGYHTRMGKHDVTDYDWENYLSFAKKWLLDD